MYERIVVVTNPNSTRAGAIGRDVILRLADEGVRFTHISTRCPSVDDNIADLTPKLHDGDIVLSAGGDGTMLGVSNAALDSGAEGITIAPRPNHRPLSRQSRSLVIGGFSYSLRLE